MKHNYIKLLPQPIFKNIFHLEWELSSKCNYHCSYCPSNLNDNKINFPEPNKFISFFQKLKNIYPEKKFHLTILGGEPTLWDKLIDVVKIIHSLSDAKIHLLTNASKNIKWWEKNLELFDNIHFSYHPEKTNKDEFFEKCKLITKTKKFLAINCMMNQKYFNDSYKFAKKLRDEIPYIVVILKPIKINDTKELIYYTDDQKDIFLNEPVLIHKTHPPKTGISFGSSIMNTIDKNGVIKRINVSQLIIKKQNSWKHWECNAGVDSMFINMNGDILRCLSQPTLTLGNINNEYNLDVNPMRCPLEFCSCKSNIFISKKQ